MQFNSALCLVLMGLALDAWACGKTRWMLPVLGSFVALMGAVTLGEYLFRTSLGVDQLFFRSYIVTATSAPGRMSPVSALSFLMAGSVMILLTRPAGPRWRPLAVGSAASFIISMSLVALAGYQFDLPGAYAWGQFSHVAMHSAAGLGLMGLGLFFIAWKLGLRPGEKTPRWLPVPLALGVIAASVVLAFAFDSKQDQEITQTVKAASDTVTNLVAARLDARIRSLVRMQRRWEFGGRPAQAAWENDAANYIHDFPDLQAIEWMDNSHIIRWIAPLAGNEGKLGRDLTKEPNRKTAIERAEQDHQPAITPMVTLFRGGSGFIVYVPIFVKGQPDGFITATINAQVCLNRFLAGVAPGEAISLSEHGRVVFTRDAGTPAQNPDWLVDAPVPVHGITWEVRMWPTPKFQRQLSSPLAMVVLCVGTAGALLLGSVCFLAQRSSRQASETTLANVALQNALDQVKTLEGLLPICSCCKSVRDDTGYWNKIETYIHMHTRASLSHGYCPKCAAKTFEDFGFEVPEEVQAQLNAKNFE